MKPEHPSAVVHCMVRVEKNHAGIIQMCHARSDEARPIHTLRCAFEADTSDPAKHTWLMAFPVQCLSNKTHSNHRTSTFPGSSLRWHPLFHHECGSGVETMRIGTMLVRRRMG